MRALVLDDKLTLKSDHPTPDRSSLPAGEALVRIRLAGICNTDLELLRGYAQFRGVLGHEFVGVVETCPADPAWEGQRVVGEINAACGHCDTCHAGNRTQCPSRTVLGIRGRDGVFADLTTLPVENLHAVPDNVNDDQAVFVEPVAAALAITDQIHMRPSDQVAVVGDGKLGQVLAQVVTLTGCDLTVVGRHTQKLSLLAARGIDTYLVDRTSSGPEIAADVVIEATGTPSGFAAARRLVRPGGKLVLKSTYHGLVQVDLTMITVDEVQVIGSRCGPFPPALRLLSQGLIDVEPLIHARYPLEQAALALERAGFKGTLKVLIEV